MRLRKIISVTVLAGLWLAAGTTIAPAASAAPAAPGDCTKTVKVPVPGTQKFRLVCVQREPGGTGSQNPGNPDDPGDDSDYDPNNYLVCNPYATAYPGHTPTRPPEVSPEAEPYVCVQYINGSPQYGPYITQWYEPGEAPLPSPAEVAGEVRVEVEGLLHEPVLEAEPGIDDPAYVSIPTFVAVTNWQDEFSEGGCDPSVTVCVTVTATPTLTFDPGEPGAETITCPPGGTRYVPGAGTPREQAVPGTCTHAYDQRTTGGLPDWPGVVTVSWEIVWAADDGSDGGVFPLIEFNADLPRGVGEIPGVVVNGPD